MQLVTERTSVNEGLEKHVPVPEEETGVLTVRLPAEVPKVFSVLLCVPG
jgi:hypothetical protein